jgi:glycosyltransferase involved in cell wall biosynthesis
MIRGLPDATDKVSRMIAEPIANDAVPLASDGETVLSGVVHIHRKAFPGQFSIETLFSALRGEMERAGCRVRQVIVPHYSKGVFRRILNGWSASRQNANVYHVTGDIHYVAVFLPAEKTILTIHDCWSLERLMGFKRWLLKLFWFDLPTRRAKFVTVISEESKRQLLRHVQIPEDKLFVIPDVVSRVYRPCPRPFHAECPRILQVGTKENKNLSRLILALKGLRCHLHVIGRLSEQQIREARAAKIDFSTACDLTDDEMYRAYCEADLVSFVSTYEGFGLPIIEANAVGRPVVTSYVSSMPEVAGDSACLVEPYDVTSIRDGLTRIVNDRQYRDSLIRKGFENVRRFQIETVTEQYVSLYRRISRQSELTGVTPQVA